MALKELFPSSPRARSLFFLVVAFSAFRLLGDQGARLGAFLLPETDALWMVGILAASALLAPRAKRLRVWTTASAIVVLAALAWPVESFRDASLRTSRILTGSVYRSSGERNRVEQVITIDPVRSGRRLPLYRLTGRSRDVTLEISGYLRAPDTGEYRIAVDADGRTSLLIDGREIVSGAIPLERGIHEIRILYERGPGPAFLDLSWDRPAFFEPLPAGYFLGSSPSAVDPGAIRQTELHSLASLFAALLWWALCASLVIRMGESFSLRQATQLLRRRAVQVFLASTLLLAAVLALLQPKDGKDPFYQQTSSERMMQTVSIADLRDQPIRSLWYLHIQPPMLDAVRDVLARVFFTTEDGKLLRSVDSGLRGLFVVFYGLLVTLVFVWLRRLTGPGVAMGATLAFALHPGLILFSTWLDSTLLSALLITWFFYELWKTCSHRGSVWRLAAAASLLFLTRSVFQWPFVLVVTASLVLIGVAPRKVAGFLLGVGLVTGLYVAKQYLLFGITYTSTFAGYNGCRSIDADVSWDTRDAPGPLPPLPSAGEASVLAREKKVNGEYNFNQLRYLRISFGLMNRYKRTLVSQPWSKTLASYEENLRIYLQPSSRYRENPVVESLPWRRLYDLAFSGAAELALFLTALGLRLWGPDVRGFLRRGLAMATPALFILVVSVLFESGENMRFRFFLEPALWVFIVTQFSSAAQRKTTRRAPD